jgi:S-adenosylmethionine:tRNA ribosyltransferase-isomerase
LIVEDREARPGLQMEVVARGEEGRLLVRVRDTGSEEDLLNRFGRVPLPPYIRDGRMVDSDLHRYQTIYARHAGSVAAPTAGLHLTKELLAQLRQAEVGLESVTLHVGLGTFRPIQTSRLDDHRMHSERAEISGETAARLNAVRAAGGRIIAVGTTSTRVLESAAGPDRILREFRGDTELFIHPPYQFRGIDGLLTNFHLPRSSLLVMLSALVGRERLLELYGIAIREGYRFYSYGDAMLVL